VHRVQPKPEQLDKERIPVVDITQLRDGSDAGAVARALHAASRDLGFIYVSGHGIPERLIDASSGGWNGQTAACRMTIRCVARTNGRSNPLN